MAAYNKTLGKFSLNDIPPAPRGIPQIEVSFDIDANGIVHVEARDKATGKSQSVTITGQSSLDKDAIEKMVADAEAHAEDDRTKKEEVEVRNTADSLAYRSAKLVSENGDKVPAPIKEALESALASTNAALAGESIEDIKDAADKLGAAAQAFSEALYSAATQETQVSDNDDIVDAEVVG